MPAPYPQEFREDVVRVARSREDGEIAGVTGIEVSAETGRLVVTTSGEIDDAQVLAAVEEAGYSAVRA
ncbi:MAG TPA: heavy metal transporter [Kocuria sp.]|nr:heavy metal transporter [Kocuria sp.]